MIGLLTSRADVEIFGRIKEKEDISPIDYEVNGKECSFTLRKTDFIYKLIKKSNVFAINSPKLNQITEYEMEQLEKSEGEFIDKFNKIDLKRSEARTIDCPLIKDSDVLECKFVREEENSEKVAIFGEILVSRRA